MAIEERLPLLAGQIQAICLARALTLATAESCTGGLVGHVITEVPGSSAYFRGGIVSYADDVKRDELDVPPELLQRHGAVSAQVARAMALGVRHRLHADIGLSVTGIAGPDGGSEAKPVGLTYLGVADADGCDVRRVVWTGSRSENKQASAAAVLELAIARLAPPPAAVPASAGDRDESSVGAAEQETDPAAAPAAGPAPTRTASR